MNESDQELIVDVQVTGNPRSFGVLIARYQGVVRSTLLRLVRSSHTADDLAQETFLKAFERIHQFERGRSFKAWLGGIAYNEFLQHTRKQKAYAQKLHHLQHSTSEITAEEPSNLLAIAKALSTLSESERTAMVLCYGFGMSHAEVATAMDVPLGTAKTRLHRAKVNVRNYIEGDTHEH